MSKQYLTTHTVDKAHITDIFSLAPTLTALLSASGSSSLAVHSTADPAFPLIQTLSNAHPLGCHHLATSRGGSGAVACSAGFGGEVRIWRRDDATGEWSLHSTLSPKDRDGADVWAVALSTDEQYMACTTHNGRVVVWDLVARQRVQTYETGSGSGAGSFGLAVDLSRDGRLTASGHQDGGVYVFNNDTGRLIYSLSGLAKPIRAVAFSPLGTRLAAAGDAGVIALYDMQHGEHIGNLAPSGASSSSPGAAWITALDFSDTGEYLLSASMDGRVRVWSIERQACVATHSETDKALWSARWLPRAAGGPRGGTADLMKGESFCAAGTNRSISFYREATGA